MTKVRRPFRLVVFGIVNVLLGVLWVVNNARALVTDSAFAFIKSGLITDSGVLTGLTIIAWVNIGLGVFLTITGILLFTNKKIAITLCRYFVFAYLLTLMAAILFLKKTMPQMFAFALFIGSIPLIIYFILLIAFVIAAKPIKDFYQSLSPVDQAYKQRKTVTAGNLHISLISIDDLITLKKKAGRGRDKIDVEALNVIKRLNRAKKTKKK